MLNADTIAEKKRELQREEKQRELQREKNKELAWCQVVRFAMEICLNL